MKIPLTKRVVKDDQRDWSIRIETAQVLVRHPRLGKIRRGVQCELIVTDMYAPHRKDFFLIGTSYFNPFDRKLGYRFDLGYGTELAFEKAVEQVKDYRMRRAVWHAWLKSKGISVTQKKRRKPAQMADIKVGMTGRARQRVVEQIQEVAKEMAASNTSVKATPGQVADAKS